MASNKSTGLFWLVVLGGVGVYYYNHSASGSVSGSHTASASPVSGKIVSVSSAEAETPYAEQQFIKAVHDGHAAYDAAGNDMQKGATRPRRAKAVCAALPSGSASNWTGKIYKLSSNSDGKGVLEIELASDVWVKTWSNSFSDIGDHTLIEPDCDLFGKVSAMSEGQSVTFSGTFLRSSTDCYKEPSMSISGSMTEPEYLMRFAAVQAN